MAISHELGKEGEEMACRHLQEKGYQILAQNWRFGRAEIDIIAQTDDTIVFVEVKTRETAIFGDPAQAVTKSKQSQIIKAAHQYLLEKDVDVEARFDIVAIIINQYRRDLEHIEDAFSPRWR